MSEKVRKKRCLFARPSQSTVQQAKRVEKGQRRQVDCQHRCPSLRLFQTDKKTQAKRARMIVSKGEHFMLVSRAAINKKRSEGG